MTHKHTPAPLFSRGRFTSDTKTTCANMYAVNDAKTDIIALFDNKADSVLFAAAPELLQWLEVAENMLTQAMKTTEFTLGACKNMTAIRETLAKAKGE